MSQTLRAAAKRAGKYIGCDPSGSGGKFPVYADRDKAQGWEQLEVTKLTDTQYAARFVDANRQLTITDDGALESRPAGAIQGWETFTATQQPDGPKFLYRMTPKGPVVLELVVA